MCVRVSVPLDCNNGVAITKNTGIMGMELRDAADFEVVTGQRGERGEHRSGILTALWFIAGAVVLAFFVYVWQRGSEERVRSATSIADLTGRINAIEPAITAMGNNLYSLNGVTSATVQGVKDIKETAYAQLYELNDTVYYNPRARAATGGSCSATANNGSRVFKQSQTYDLASTTVTVDDYCRSCG